MNRYLQPRAVEKAGLKDEDFNITSNAVDKLISDYCREPGVRSLQRFIGRIMEKIALDVVKAQEIKEKKEEK